jgi:hypothetical protein
MKKIIFLLTLQLFSFFTKTYAQTFELSADRHIGATGINLTFNSSEVSSEKLFYTKYGFGYNIIDEKYKYKEVDPNEIPGFESSSSEDDFFKLDQFNLAFTTGLKYNYLLNLPSNMDIRTGVRASVFQGLFAEMEGVYLIGESFGVILRGGYRVLKLVSEEKSSESLGTFEGAFFGAAITF